MVGEPVDVSSLVGGAPAGVLLVDLRTRQVIHVNPVAEQLAPLSRLPLPLEEWSDAAELRDLAGEELSETHHPLSRIARSEPVAGQAVTAARRSDLGEQRATLWVVALPLGDAPGLEGHALVVLIPITDHRSQAVILAAAEHAELNELAGLPELDDLGEQPDRAGADALHGRAVAATSLSFTVADVLDPDQPLVWVNPAFTATTGYSFDEVVGRNCRFLQGDRPDPASAQMRDAIRHGRSCRVTLVNYRKDGMPFWNQVDLSPVRDGEGRVTHYVGIQSDVTERVDAELALQRAFLAEQRARADAESARARLTFLVEAVNRLSGTLDIDLCSERLLQLVVPELADWALLIHLGDHGEVTGSRAVHRDPARRGDADDLAATLPAAMRSGSAVDLVLQGKPVRIIEHLDSEQSHSERASYLRDLSFTEKTARLDSSSAMGVALFGRSTVREILVLVRGPGRPAFESEDVDVGLDLGHRAGLILDNARLYQSQRLIAETLQHSLLSELPQVAGLEVAARYQVGDQAAQVGGDFYELMAYDDGSVGVAIGDVVGHDVLAAAAMGHLKGMLRALAYAAGQQTTDPGLLLDNLDALIAKVGVNTIATVVYAHLTPAPGGWEMQWANAGHLPPAVRLPDGTAHLLGTEHADLLLGAGRAVRTTRRQFLPHGSTLVLYTDGLVEHRARPLDDGLEEMQRIVADLTSGAAEACDRLFAANIAGPTDDDVAAIVVHLPRDGALADDRSAS